MKSKLLVVPVLSVLLLGPAMSAFAETPVLAKTEKAGKFQKQAGVNFCKNISDLEAKVTTKVDEKSALRFGKRDQKNGEIEQKREDHIAKITDTRAQHDAKFTARVEEMKAKMTNVDPAKIDEFQKEMLALVGDRRQAIDAEFSSFVKEIDSAKLAKSTEVTKALEILKTDIATATTKAKDGCSKEGADSAAIAATFKADMKAAHDKFKSTLSTLKDGTVKTIREEHKAEVKEIRLDSEQKIKGIRSIWANFFGKKSPKNVEAPVQ